MKGYLIPSLLVSLVDAHGYVKAITIDGTVYPGYSPMVDPRYPGIKRIEWGFPKQNTAGVGPVLDVTTPDIACRKDAIAPALIAPARAGAQISFKWTNYFTSHKGPVLTYMGLLPDATTKAQDVKFFKIDEGTYDPKTGTWGSDTLIKQNNTWSTTIPSDIKPGKYIIRHELIALHFGGTGNPKGSGTASSGAQLYPVCVNVDVTGSGTATPPGEKFPGAYKPNDPGILVNIYFGPNTYKSPGPAVYKGKHDPPQGPTPVVKETGFFEGQQRIAYDRAVASADAMFHSIVDGVNTVLPGGGGSKYDVGFGAYKAPVNGGKSVAPVGSLLAGGLLPAGVVPGKGYVGNGKDGKGAKTAPAKGAKGAKAGSPAVMAGAPGAAAPKAASKAAKASPPTVPPAAQAPAVLSARAFQA